MQPAATLLLLGITAAGCGQAAQTAVPTSPRLTLHRVTLPALPKWVLRKFGSACDGPCVWDGVAVGANGDILAAVGDRGECCYLYGLVRFDSRRRQWLRGGILNPKVPAPCSSICFAAGPPFLPIGRAVWMINTWSGSVYRGRFSAGWSTPKEVVSASGCKRQPPCRPRGSPTRPWGSVNVLIPARQGRVWVVGSTKPLCYASDAATFVCGRSLVGLAGGRSRHIRAIPVSRSGTVTDATVGSGGSLWLLVPRYRRCPHASCRRSALIRYDPTRRRLTRYMIPARLWPDIGALGGGDNNGWVYTQPSGMVWIVAAVNRGLRVIRFHHGSFSSRTVRLRFQLNLRPPMDRNGDIWFCDGTAHTVTVVDPRTGQRTKLRNRRGTSLLQDMHGAMWYVKGDLTGWSSC